MNRVYGLILTTVLALALSSIAASFFTASLAQPGPQDPTSSRKPACGCFICGELAVEASRKGSILPFNFVSFDQKDCAGILAEDACPTELAQLPKEQVEGFCEKIKSGLGFTSFKDSCPVLAAACEPDKKPPPDAKCKPPSNIPEPPWLQPDLPCQERTKGTISWKVIPETRDRSYKVSLCGEIINYVLLRGAGPPPKGAFGGGTYTNAPGVRVFDVCCDSWRNAANTRSPCDARRDIDCDGMFNEVDRFADIPDDNRSWRDYFSFNGPYSGAPNADIWTEFHPPDQSECKDCKWELVRYESTCKNVPNLTASDSTGMDIFDAKHKVKATWKCPAKGQTKESEETVIVQSVRCPLP